MGNSGAGTLTIQSQATAYAGTSLTIGTLGNVNLNGGTLRFNTVTGINRLIFNSGTVQLAGNRIVGGAGDPTISALFGGNPVIPSGKSLTVEGLANALTLTIDGGRFRSLSTLNVGLSLNSTLHDRKWRSSHQCRRSCWLQLWERIRHGQRAGFCLERQQQSDTRQCSVVVFLRYWIRV